MKKNYSTGKNNYFTGYLICCLLKLDHIKRLSWYYQLTSAYQELELATSKLY